MDVHRGFWSLTHPDYILCVTFSPLDRTPRSHPLPWWRQRKGEYLVGPFVEDHLSIYWAILKRPPAAVEAVKTGQVTNSDPDALVLAILDALIPISAASVEGAHLACVMVSDNALFAGLEQRYEAFSPRSGTDRMLLAGSGTVDTVSVEEACGSGFRSRSSNCVCAYPNRPGSNS